MSHVTHTGVIAWSTFTLLTPTFAESDVTQLLGVRMMVGAAEAVRAKISKILKKFITKSKSPNGLSIPPREPYIISQGLYELLGVHMHTR